MMRPEEIRELREYLQLTQEVFARILGVSFATVNRWENGKSAPSGDYARVLQTLRQLTSGDSPARTIDWQRVGALSAMAAVAGFSPLLTLGAALAPVLIAHLPSWTDVPLGGTVSERVRLLSQGKSPMGTARRSQKPTSVGDSKPQAAKSAHTTARRSARATRQRKSV
jgi:DNA-binding XRE family transcriptional regulator